MNEAIKTKWTTALESGEYLQGTDWLCSYDAVNDKNRFCCLGVLTDMYTKETGKGEWKKPDLEQSKIFKFITTDGSKSANTLLPKEVMDWAELNFDNPHIVYQGYRTLATANDGCVSFTELAQVIREQL